MNSNYERLISLVLEIDFSSTPDNISELNSWLSQQKATEIQSQHLSSLDDLICILHNTSNIDRANHDAIISLQEKIR